MSRLPYHDLRDISGGTRGAPGEADTGVFPGWQCVSINICVVTLSVIFRLLCDTELCVPFFYSMFTCMPHPASLVPRLYFLEKSNLGTRLTMNNQQTTSPL